MTRSGRDLLHDIDLTVRRGEHWALLGPNGAGKSTLLAVLGATGHPSGGTVEILGERLGRVDVRALREHIGHVDPRHRMLSPLTVRETVLTGLTGTTDLMTRWEPTADQVERAEQHIADVGLSARRTPAGPCCRRGTRSCAHRPGAHGGTRAAAARRTRDRTRRRRPRAPARDRRRAATAAPRARQRHGHPPPRGPADVDLARDAAAGRRRGGAGPADEVITSSAVSHAFDFPLAILAAEGRWAARASAAERRPRGRRARREPPRRPPCLNASERPRPVVGEGLEPDDGVTPRTSRGGTMTTRRRPTRGRNRSRTAASRPDPQQPGQQPWAQQQPGRQPYGAAGRRRAPYAPPPKQSRGKRVLISLLGVVVAVVVAIRVRQGYRRVQRLDGGEGLEGRRAEPRARATCPAPRRRRFQRRLETLAGSRPRATRSDYDYTVSANVDPASITERAIHARRRRAEPAARTAANEEAPRRGRRHAVHLRAFERLVERPSTRPESTSGGVCVLSPRRRRSRVVPDRRLGQTPASRQRPRARRRRLGADRTVTPETPPSRCGPGRQGDSRRRCIDGDSAPPTPRRRGFWRRLSVSTVSRSTSASRHRPPARRRASRRAARAAPASSVAARRRRGLRRRGQRVERSAPTAASSCAAVTNHASNTDGGRVTPASSMAWKNGGVAPGLLRADVVVVRAAPCSVKANENRLPARCTVWATPSAERADDTSRERWSATCGRAARRPPASRARSVAMPAATATRVPADSVPAW